MSAMFYEMTLKGKGQFVAIIMKLMYYVENRLGLSLGMLKSTIRNSLEWVLLWHIVSLGKFIVVVAVVIMTYIVGFSMSYDNELMFNRTYHLVFLLQDNNSEFDASWSAHCYRGNVYLSI